jgi:hypothetical protein
MLSGIHISCVKFMNLMEARGSVVVKGLCYKPEGRGLEIR